MELAQQKVPQADVYVGDICDPELHVDSLDVVLSCDVLYITGIAAAFPGLSRLVQALRPGGLLVVNLPAYQWMYSEHDVAVHTSERYTARQVKGLLRDLGLRVHLLTYRLFSLFPLVLLWRVPGILGPRPRREQARSDLGTPNRLVNASLKAVMSAENLAIKRGLRFPWGSSVYAVGRKE